MKNIKRDMLFLALTPLGFVSYLIINYLLFGDPLKFLQFQREHWTEYFVSPIRGFLWARINSYWRVPADNLLLGWVQIAFGILGFLLTVYSRFSLSIE